MKLTLRIYARAAVCLAEALEGRPPCRPNDAGHDGACPSNGLSAVVTDRFDRAAFHRFLAKTFFLGRLRLLVDVGVTTVVVALEIRGRGLPAQIAIDALLVDIKLPRGVFRIFVRDVGHNLPVEGVGS
jgi:hypothetical protein